MFTVEGMQPFCGGRRQGSGCRLGTRAGGPAPYQATYLYIKRIRR
jgi:hypothetical protein